MRGVRAGIYESVIYEKDLMYMEFAENGFFFFRFGRSIFFAIFFW